MTAIRVLDGFVGAFAAVGAVCGLVFLASAGGRLPAVDGLTGVMVVGNVACAAFNLKRAFAPKE
ncbi:MAG: hypothetical protein C0467_31480 [Planctomycetaceae bacterium]|nr:hypothetical protein [Planctomycetaceae bacterium]